MILPAWKSSYAEDVVAAPADIVWSDLRRRRPYLDVVDMLSEWIATIWHDPVSGPRCSDRMRCFGKLPKVRVTRHMVDRSDLAVYWHYPTAQISLPSRDIMAAEAGPLLANLRKVFLHETVHAFDDVQGTLRQNPHDRHFQRRLAGLVERFPVDTLV